MVAAKGGRVTILLVYELVGYLCPSGCLYTRMLINRRYDVWDMLKEIIWGSLRLEMEKDMAIFHCIHV